MSEESNIDYLNRVALNRMRTLSYQGRIKRSGKKYWENLLADYGEKEGPSIESLEDTLNGQ